MVQKRVRCGGAICHHHHALALHIMQKVLNFAGAWLNDVLRNNLGHAPDHAADCTDAQDVE